MGNTNGHTPRLLFLLSEANSAWFQDIRAQLPGYDVDKAQTADEVLRVYQEKQPDMIVAMPTVDSLQLFETIRTKSEQSARPVLALIADTLVTTPPAQSADLFLPPTPLYFRQLLSAFLHLQEENRTLRSDNQRLQQELLVRKRSLEEVNMLKNAIVRNVGHELKTPLLQVKSAVALLAEDVGDSTLATYATEATARLEGVVKNITQLAESFDLNMGPVLIKETVDYAVRNLRRSWERKNDIHRVHVELESGLPPVMGNKQALGTVMQLLVDNALKFSNEIVEVNAQRRDNRVIVSVRDYGIGIARDQFEQIFESFYQVDNSDRRRFGGTGVGLAIVRLIMDRHNTKVEVESVESKGSTFSFTLPIMDIRGGLRSGL